MASVAVAETGELVESDGYVTLQRTGLVFVRDTPFEVWEAVAQRLTSAPQSVQWWIGDALNFGERQYGEMYTQAIRATGLDYQTLANWKWVASRYESSPRGENLNWAHHRKIAALEPKDRALWLGRAENEGGSVSRLRSAVQTETIATDEAWWDDDDAGEPASPDWVPGSAKPHIALNGGDNEWYTPPEYIAAA